MQDAKFVLKAGPRSHTSTHTHTYTHIYTYIHMCTHTHTHTHTRHIVKILGISVRGRMLASYTRTRTRATQTQIYIAHEHENNKTDTYIYGWWVAICTGQTREFRFRGTRRRGKKKETVSRDAILI